MEAFSPNHKIFKKIYDSGKPQVLFTTLSADLYTPVSTLIKFKNHKYTFLFESVEKGNNKGRYSFLGIEPDLIWECKNKKCLVRNLKENTVDKIKNEVPIESLRKFFLKNKFIIPQNLPPMSSGLFGYIGYDMIQNFENIDLKNIDDLNIPDSIFIRPTLMLIFDNVSDKLYIVKSIWPDSSRAENVLKNSIKHIKKVIKILQKPLIIKTQKIFFENQSNLSLLNGVKTNVEFNDFKKMVKKAKKYIYSGEIFQVVLSRRFKKKIKTSSISIYRALRYLNPSPYLFYINFNNFSVVGSSPEILVRLNDKTVTIRPIAGTRKRGKDLSEDIKLKKDLLSDPKEISEHLMLLDLGRNDISRVTKAGSVEVTDHMIVEYFSHVMHIVSNINGTLKDDSDNVDALLGGFPAGTVSGAPKIRAMEIIEELENTRRKIYAGSIGYLSSNGNLDSCIVLRTAIIKNKHIYIQSGAGIVAESEPRNEFKEIENKAMALLQAEELSKKF